MIPHSSMQYPFFRKCQKYSPSEPSKLYDKALTRKTEQDFTSEYLHLFFDDEKLTHQVMMDYYLKVSCIKRLLP